MEASKGNADTERSREGFRLALVSHELRADLRRVQLSLALEGVQGQVNAEVHLLDPDGVQQAGTLILGLMNPRFTITLHLRQPARAGDYRCCLVLSDEHNQAMGKVEQVFRLLPHERSD